MFTFLLQVLAPCVLLIDDVDAIATKRENATKNMESRLVTQLSNSMDGQWIDGMFLYCRLSFMFALSTY